MRSVYSSALGIRKTKVFDCSSHLIKIAILLNKPIEYFYGKTYLGSDVQDLIAIMRKMSPEAREDQLPMILMYLEMLEIGEAVNTTAD